MRYYYMLYTIILFTALLTKISNLSVQKQNKVLCTVSFILIAGLLGLRHWSMGVDLGYYTMPGFGYGYVQSFQRLNSYSWSKILEINWLNYERGYIIFNKLIGSIKNDKQFLLMVCAILSILPVMIMIYKRSKNPLLSVIVFIGLPMFLIYFSGLRQGIAIGITMLSLKYIEQKKKFKFILMILLAGQFHKSSMVFLIAYPFYYLKLSNFSKLLCVASIPIVYFFKKPLFIILSKLIKEDAMLENTGAVNLFLIFFLLYIFLIMFNSKRTTEREVGYINLFYIACICQAFSGVYNTAIRVGYYFMIYLCLAIPNTIYNVSTYENNLTSQTILTKKKHTSLFFYVMFLLLFVIYGLYTFKNGSWAMTYPYYFYWSRY